MTVSEKKKLYRDTANGKVGGVCAGIANYFNWEVWVVRIIAVTLLIFASKVTFVAYIIAWMVLDKAPEGSDYKSEPNVVREEWKTEKLADGRTIEVKTRVWERGEPPKEAVKDIAKSFAGMETSLRDMERYVTSRKFQVKQEINRL